MSFLGVVILSTPRSSPEVAHSGRTRRSTKIYVYVLRVRLRAYAVRVRIQPPRARAICILQRLRVAQDLRHSQRVPVSFLGQAHVITSRLTCSTRTLALPCHGGAVGRPSPAGAMTWLQINASCFVGKGAASLRVLFSVLWFEDDLGVCPCP